MRSPRAKSRGSAQRGLGAIPGSARLGASTGLGSCPRRWARGSCGARSGAAAPCPAAAVLEPGAGAGLGAGAIYVLRGSAGANALQSGTVRPSVVPRAQRKVLGSAAGRGAGERLPARPRCAGCDDWAAAQTLMSSHFLCAPARGLPLPGYKVGALLHPQTQARSLQQEAAAAQVRGQSTRAAALAPAGPEGGERNTGARPCPAPCHCLEHPEPVSELQHPATLCGSCWIALTHGAAIGVPTGGPHTKGGAPCPPHARPCRTAPVQDQAPGRAGGGSRELRAPLHSETLLGALWPQKGSAVSRHPPLPRQDPLPLPGLPGGAPSSSPHGCAPPHPNATPMPPSLGPGGVAHGRAPTNLRLASLLPDLS